MFVEGSKHKTTDLCNLRSQGVKLMILLRLTYCAGRSMVSCAGRRMCRTPQKPAFCRMYLANW